MDRYFKSKKNIREAISHMDQYLTIRKERNTVEEIISILWKMEAEYEDERTGTPLGKLFKYSFGKRRLQITSNGMSLPTYEKFWSTRILFNEAAIRAVFEALVDNAIRYSRPGGPLIIKEQSGEDLFGVRLSNIGPLVPHGMSIDPYCFPSPHANIFSRQSRGDVAAELSPDRPGLGLALVHYFSRGLGFKISYRVAPIQSAQDGQTDWVWHHITLKFGSCDFENKLLR